jgi:ketosteroid isomerase-like protein
MTKEQLIKMSESVLGAWNTQAVESVVACYTPDLTYRDPNTRGAVEGADAMRRYLTKLFSAWTMHWSLREVYPFAEADGGAFLWRARLSRAGSEKAVEVDGMDLVLMENDRIKRNEVYFDRAALASLFQ